MLNEDHKLRAYYDQIIDNAVQDAAYVLSRYSHETPEDSDSNLTSQNIRGIAADTLMDSIYYSFNVYGDSVGMEGVKSHIPILLFLEDDGYVVYALNEYQGPEGYRIINYCWYPKRPYSGGVIDHYIIRYTLSDTVMVYDQTTDLETEGLFSDFSGIIPAFGSRPEFEQRRLTAVSQAIEKDLEYYIGRFNDFSMKMGVTYRFRFPRIEDADWLRALADEGILVFAQGFPVLNGSAYECNAFGGARILKKPTIAGYADQGRMTYCRDTCVHFLDVCQDPGFDVESVTCFTDAREAAKNGYYPCDICRP